MRLKLKAKIESESDKIEQREMKTISLIISKVKYLRNVNIY